MSSKPLYGVGGWLLFFVVLSIISLIISPLLLNTQFNFAVKALTISFLWLSVLLYFLFSYITGLGFNWMDWMDARPVIPAIIWTLYFKESIIESEKPVFTFVAVAGVDQGQMKSVVCGWMAPDTIPIASEVCGDKIFEVFRTRVPG